MTGLLDGPDQPLVSVGGRFFDEFEWRSVDDVISSASDRRGLGDLEMGDLEQEAVGVRIFSVDEQNKCGSLWGRVF